MKKNAVYIGFPPSASVDLFIEKKLKGLEKLMKSLDPGGAGEAFFELSRTTRHHHKGNVYRVAVDIKIPAKVFHAEVEGSDVLSALNEVKDKLKILLEKYKERITASRKNG